MVEPNLKDWAKSIVYMIKHSGMRTDYLEDVVEHELKQIAHTYYVLGDETGWAKAFDAYKRTKR